MTPAVQTAIVFVVLALAMLYIGRRFVREFRSAKASRDGCASGCGCEPGAGSTGAKHH